MALKPKVKISILNTCDKLDVVETTLPYNVTTNVTGWGGTLNIDTTDITDSKIEIFDHTGVTLLSTIVMYDGTTDVYSGTPGAPTPGEFFALADVEFTEPDGIYKIVYTITDGSLKKYVNDLQYELFLCNLCKCINDIKAKLVTECDSETLQKHKDNLEQLEIIKYGIEAAFSCGNFTKANNLITSAKKICDNLCDCGCGDC